jgi:hypothetical protein
MVFRGCGAHHEGMDAYELTRPILAASPLLGRRRGRVEPCVDVLAAARRYVGQLPLGLTIVHRLAPARAAAEIERALVDLAVDEGVAVSVDEAVEELARRLVGARAIVVPAADAIALLVPLLRDTASIEGVRLAEQLVAYLEHRTVIARRFPVRRP